MVTGPVDTTVLAAPGVFRRCLELAGADPGADPGVDVVLAVTATTAAGDPVPEVSAATADGAGAGVTISVLHEQVFGPLVLAGLAAGNGGGLAHRAARITPLTDAYLRRLP